MAIGEDPVGSGLRNVANGATEKQRSWSDPFAIQEENVDSR